MTLQSRNAIVTGSTCGIGLAIARAFAKEGANVTINGFGDAAAIEKRARRASRRISASSAVYSPADMTKPAEIAAMVAEAETAFGCVDILVNNAGIQHVAPIEEFPDREVGPDHRDQPVRGLPRHPRRDAGHEGAQMGPHHQHRLGPFAGRLAVQVGLCRRQARHRRPDQDRGARARDLRHHRQLHLARAMSGRRWSRSKSPTR